VDATGVVEMVHLSTRDRLQKKVATSKGSGILAISLACWQGRRIAVTCQTLRTNAKASLFPLEYFVFAGLRSLHQTSSCPPYVTEHCDRCMAFLPRTRRRIQFSLTERSQDICFAPPSHLTSKCRARRAALETAAGFCGTDTLVAAA
jgi:hypothetical protein